MARSIESSRPIMAPSVSSKRASQRFSTYSGIPPSVASENTVNTTTSSTNGDPRLQEIKAWTKGFDRLDSQRLQQQRYTPTEEKSDDLSKIALGAKVERALARRLSSQDASMRPRRSPMSEKSGLVTPVRTSS
ncbi:hypothetical protein MMC20_007392 [Loxospora ochrophaea]|nr:hypothetical protein [Loxospora ochrophaea]